MLTVYELTWGYAVIETGQPSDPCRIGIGDTPAAAARNLEATPWQSAEAYRMSDRFMLGSVMDDSEGVGPMRDADETAYAIARYVIDESEAASDLRSAIDRGDEDDALLVAAAIREAGIEAEIETDLSDDEEEVEGVRYRTHRQGLIVAGEKVADWQRVIAGAWGGEYGERPADTWDTWEDTQGDGGIPAVVRSVLDELDLDPDCDGLPGPSEPDEPEEDPVGRYGYAAVRDGDIPTEPDCRYSTASDRDEAMGFWQRSMRRQYPGGWLEPHLAKMRLEPEGWVVEE